ncbi:glycosyltransferase involved in cell wall biosynthesis [Gelidibacter algens]|uniref:Glycosyltransferase involved in cell wall biosynthesis n=2 Tax=Gelidibacter algens TaxID=49280 RepID=A0A327SFS3_9FLAO|nr:glycosyltransferase [Gelidibacter algens]RAJ27435.1 glycosyltransferase involved in cell wall biosynthesis [Gelidibacter algens]
MKTKKKIFFVIPTLSAGGAERVISFVAQELDREKFDVTLIIIGFEKDNKYDVSSIPVVYLNKSRVLKGAFPLLIMFQKEKPKMVVSTISNLNVIMGLISVFFSNVIFIGRHTFIIKNPSKNIETKKTNRSKIKSTFNYWNYGNKNLDYFICQSADMKQSIIDVYGIDSKKISIINNPVTQTEIIKNNSSQGAVKKYITIGRISEGKGYIRILEILAKLSFPFQYTIIGEGAYYDIVFSKIRELGLNDKVNYIRFTNNVSEYLVDHDMFLQGSYSEGFPNALLESCAVGTPVIAFNVPGGTKEIIEDGINGFLVDNDDDFLEKLNDNREWNPEIVRESVYKKFNKNKIISDYEKFFIEISD